MRKLSKRDARTLAQVATSVMIQIDWTDAAVVTVFTSTTIRLAAVDVIEPCRYSGITYIDYKSHPLQIPAGQRLYFVKCERPGNWYYIVAANCRGSFVCTCHHRFHGGHCPHCGTAAALATKRMIRQQMAALAA